MRARSPRPPERRAKKALNVLGWKEQRGRARRTLAATRVVRDGGGAKSVVCPTSPCPESRAGGVRGGGPNRSCVMALGSVSGADVSLLVRYARVSLEIWLGLAWLGTQLQQHLVRDPAHPASRSPLTHSKACASPLLSEAAAAAFRRSRTAARAAAATRTCCRACSAAARGVSGGVAAAPPSQKLGPYVVSSSAPAQVHQTFTVVGSEAPVQPFRGRPKLAALGFIWHEPGASGSGLGRGSLFLSQPQLGARRDGRARDGRAEGRVAKGNVRHVEGCADVR